MINMLHYTKSADTYKIYFEIDGSSSNIDLTQQQLVDIFGTYMFKEIKQKEYPNDIFDKLNHTKKGNEVEKVCSKKSVAYDYIYEKQSCDICKDNIYIRDTNSLDIKRGDKISDYRWKVIENAGLYDRAMVAMNELKKPENSKLTALDYGLKFHHMNESEIIGGHICKNPYCRSKHDTRQLVMKYPKYFNYEDNVVKYDPNFDSSVFSSGTIVYEDLNDFLVLLKVLYIHMKIKDITIFTMVNIMDLVISEKKGMIDIFNNFHNIAIIADDKLYNNYKNILHQIFEYAKGSTKNIWICVSKDTKDKVI